MLAVFKRSLAAAALVAFASPALRAQQPHPSTEQIQQALATNPGLADQIRAKIGASGLSPDQIRARLRAAGYPDNLLDPYMSGAPTDSTLAPGDDVLRAVRFLGLVDSTAVSATRTDTTSRPDTTRRTRLEAPPDTNRIFGLDVFRRSTSQFEPDVAGPVDPNYKIGPRDVLALIMTGGVENSYTLEVTREGFIVVPQVGQIYVANLTLEQASDVVFRRMQSVYSALGRGAGASTHFYLTVAKLRTNQIFVVGDVEAPGSYQISSAGTMLTALYAAGGPSDNGSLRGIELRRGGSLVGTLDVYDYLTKGDASHDLRLESGDVVFVPVHGPRVRASGEFVRPAQYELRQGETLQDLVRMAGGFTAVAGRSRVLIRRIVPPAERTTGGPARTTLDITSDQLATGLGPAVPLADGDVVHVFGIAERVRNLVTIEGAVWTPGPQGFTPGMRLSDALKKAGGVRPDVKDVLVSRLESDRSRSELRAAFRDTLGALMNDIPLQEDDSITVFGTSDFRPDRYVVITGAVKTGGRFPWREGMTMHDLVHLAGGLQDGAFLGEAEVARLPESRESGTLAVTMRVPLDSTYLLDRGLDGKYDGPPGLPASAASAPEVELRPYDNVLILRQPDWQLERSVTLAGEVRYPGTYALESKDERVTDLLKRAGGLMPRAYVGGAIFTRTAGSLGRIGIDLEAALRDPRSRENLVILPGDSIYIPRYLPTVKVEGAVHSPISVAYVPGKDINYYIDAAGGAIYNADVHRSYVVQPNGIVDPYKARALLIPDHRPEPEPGATVEVPTKDPNENRVNYASIAASVAQILASTVAIVAIALRK